VPEPPEVKHAPLGRGLSSRDEQGLESVVLELRGKKRGVDRRTSHVEPRYDAEDADAPH
jgi:hypothetical protein